MMNKLLTGMALCGSLLLGSQHVNAECREYTNEQNVLLHTAYVIGDNHGLGYTLAAIVRQEAIVGKFIVKVNEKDRSGSYGVTHIQLDTARWLEGVDNIWEAKEKIVPRLINDDLYAMNLALRKLETVRVDDWRQWISRYNGAGPKARKYAEHIASHVRDFKSCRMFEMYGAQ